MKFRRSLLAALLAYFIFMMLPGHVFAQPPKMDLRPVDTLSRQMSPSPLLPGEYEIAYDDGAPEFLSRWGTPCNYFAVLFTVPDPPGYPRDLVKARLYIYWNTAEFEIVVYDSDGVTVLWSQVVQPTGGTGWIDVQIPSLNIERDFYIAMHYTIVDNNYLGNDSTDPDGRSYKGPPMTLYPEGDWMIRAVVSWEVVGGVIQPINNLILMAPPVLTASVALVALALIRHRRK